LHTFAGLTIVASLLAGAELREILIRDEPALREELRASERNIIGRIGDIR
jgi:hypothetical protein